MLPCLQILLADSLADPRSGGQDFDVVGGDFAPHSFETGLSQLRDAGNSGQLRVRGGNLAGTTMINGRIVQVSVHGGDVNGSLAAAQIGHLATVADPNSDIGGSFCERSNKLQRALCAGHRRSAADWRLHRVSIARPRV